MFGGQAALSMNYAIEKLRFLEIRKMFTNNFNKLRIQRIQNK